MVHFIFSLLIGALSGYIAGRIMGSRTSALRNVILGFLGGAVGSALFGLIGIHSYNWLGDVIVAVIGACICIWIGRRIFD